MPSLSVSQLNRCKVTFLDGVGTICKKNGGLILSASVKNHLYWVDEAYVRVLTNWCNEHMLLSEEAVERPLINIQSVIPDDTNEAICIVTLQDLHEKLGHLSEYNLKRILREELLKGTGVSYENVKDERKL